MSFLSPLALLFGLTALVPLILHLYQRRRRTIVLFSTNRFFTQSVIRSQRRLRLRRILLLIMRIAACLFLALALAQPIMSLAGFGGGRGTRDVVILLDDSFSMQATDARAAAAARSHFDRARKLAARTLDALTSGDRAVVITFTGRALGRESASGTELTGDLPQLQKRIEQLKCTSAAGNAHAALDRTVELFKGAEHRGRSLLVLSDLQNADWPSIDYPQPDHAVGVAIVQTAPPTQDNVVAEQLTLSQGSAVVGQPNLVRAVLVNHRDQTVRAQLVLQLDDKEILRRPVDLPAQSLRVEHIPLSFETPGEHRIRLQIDCPDNLPPDNVLYSTVTVQPRLPVLLVDGGTSQRDEKSPAFYLKVALSACSDSSSQGESVRVETIQPPDLGKAALEQFRVIILSDVRDIPLPQLERLERFVQSGGGLVALLGEQANLTFYQDVMGNPSRPLGGLLPADVRSRIGAAESAQPMHILEAELDHPILQRFKGTLRGALATINVYQAYAVSPRDAYVLAAMEHGQPLLLERSYGQGKSILLTTIPSPRWSNLPLRPVFIPLINQTISYLAGGQPREEHSVGSELVILRTSAESSPPSAPVIVDRPNGGAVQAAVKVVGSEPVAYLLGDAVDQPGFYHLQPVGRAKWVAKTAPEEWMAVNVPRQESATTALHPDEFKFLSGNWRVKTVGTMDAARDDEADARQIAAWLGSAPASWGVWDVLLWTVLLLLIVEPLIANRIPSGASAESTPSIGQQKTGSTGPYGEEHARGITAA
jgi:hypothetical protein